MKKKNSKKANKSMFKKVGAWVKKNKMNFVEIAVASAAGAVGGILASTYRSTSDDVVEVTEESDTL